jgi:hypothetical protein
LQDLLHSTHAAVFSEFCYCAVASNSFRRDDVKGLTMTVLRTSSTSPNQPSVLSAPLQLSPYSSVDLSPAESAAIAAAARAGGGSPAADDPFMDLEEIEGSFARFGSSLSFCAHALLMHAGGEFLNEELQAAR